MLRDFNFCVIDEVDSILIDEARTPLIISGAAERPSAQYYQARRPPRRARGAARAACRAACARPPRRAAAPGRSSFLLLACRRVAHCREGPQQPVQQDVARRLPSVAASLCTPSARTRPAAAAPAVKAPGAHWRRRP